MKFQTENIMVSLKEIDKSVIDIDKELLPYIVKTCNIQLDDIVSYKILNKSIDARKKSNIKLNYRLLLDAKANIVELKNAKTFEDKKPLYKELQQFSEKVIIVGTGPAGLMSALLLAQARCTPLILDRGFNVEQRNRDIDTFFKNRELNENSNFLYGEGGAGTYSDGKLYTRKKDPRTKFILNEFINAGAP